jgi:hypothetical protein
VRPEYLLVSFTAHTRVRHVGQYRLNQAHAPVEHADNPATLRHELNGGGSGTGVQTETSSPMGGNSSGQPHRSFADSTVAKALWPAGQQEQAGKESAGKAK